MNLRDDSWFGQIQVSGISKPVTLHGSLTSMVLEMMIQMRSLNAKESGGRRTVTFLFSDRPISAESKDSMELEKRVAEVTAGIEGEITGGPNEGESYVEYYDRLIQIGFNPVAAAYQANDWFDKPQDSDLLKWISDPMAQRFRVLNSSHAAFEAALPSEYATLKEYVLVTHPRFTEGIVFRTA